MAQLKINEGVSRSIEASRLASVDVTLNIYSQDCINYHTLDRIMNVIVEDFTQYDKVEYIEPSKCIGGIKHTKIIIKDDN